MLIPGYDSWKLRSPEDEERLSKTTMFRSLRKQIKQERQYNEYDAKKFWDVFDEELIAKLPKIK